MVFILNQSQQLIPLIFVLVKVYDSDVSFIREPLHSSEWTKNFRFWKWSTSFTEPSF